MKPVWTLRHLGGFSSIVYKGNDSNEWLDRGYIQFVQGKVNELLEIIIETLNMNPQVTYDEGFELIYKYLHRNTDREKKDFDDEVRKLLIKHAEHASGLNVDI